MSVTTNVQTDEGQMRLLGNIVKATCKHCQRPIFTLREGEAQVTGWTHYEERERKGRTLIHSIGRRCRPTTAEPEPEEASL